MYRERERETHIINGRHIGAERPGIRQLPDSVRANGVITEVRRVRTLGKSLRLPNQETTI